MTFHEVDLVDEEWVCDHATAEGGDGTIVENKWMFHRGPFFKELSTETVEIVLVMNDSRQECCVQK